MVGGGIGVTPYASILNDLVFGTSTNRYSGVACKKVSKMTSSVIVKLNTSSFKLPYSRILGVLPLDLSVPSLL